MVGDGLLFTVLRPWLIVLISSSDTFAPMFYGAARLHAG